MRHEPSTLVDLLSRLVEQLGSLFQQEVELARTETSERLAATTGALAVVAGGVALIAIALLLLLQAAVLGLRLAGIPAHWSLLIVAVIALLSGAVVLALGLRAVQSARLAPTRTLAGLRRDIRTAKEELT